MNYFNPSTTMNPIVKEEEEQSPMTPLQQPSKSEETPKAPVQPPKTPQQPLNSNNASKKKSGNNSKNPQTTTTPRQPKPKVGLKERRGVTVPPLNFDENAQLLPRTPPPSPAPKADSIQPLKKRFRAAFTYDEKVLEKYFGKNSLNAVELNHSYIRRSDVDVTEYTFQYLRRNIIFKINGGASPVCCMLTRHGALAMFDIPKEDIDAFNNILRFLLYKDNADPTKHSVTPLRPLTTLYLHGDRLTTYYNDDGKEIGVLPNCNFEANIAVKIMGIQLRKIQSSINNNIDGDGDADDGVREVKLILHLDQVRMVNDDKQCLF
jgi:hypothetical protein